MEYDSFLAVIAFAGIGMLIWDCVEVGRNDAANLINAVFGARVMTRRNAVWLAGFAVILGASFASPVMDTARKKIFDPAEFTVEAAMIIYITVYVVDTVLLYTLSAFGMPVSTTASLIFELVGAALGVSLSIGAVQWPIVGKVVSGIFVSILLSGIASFVIQRAFRGAIGKNAQDPIRVLLHGPWVAGSMIAGLSWFMVMKGLKGVDAVKEFKKLITTEDFGEAPFVFALWAASALLVYGMMVFRKDLTTKYLFHGTAIVGMVCIAFAFGQNDLANCASPGISAFTLYQHRDLGTEGFAKIELEIWHLFVCGLLMAVGMGTKSAQRVTRAAVNTGSQYDHVALWAPEWCKRIARLFVTHREAADDPVLAPAPATTEEGKRIHYDTLRASVIMAVSASVIAFASGKGLPVSTTYVAFAAVVATAWGDRVFHRGDADVKVGRAIWVVTCWFLAAFIAMIVSAGVAFGISRAGLIGLALAFFANLGVRFYVKKRAEKHEQRFHLNQDIVKTDSAG